jgi:nitrate reductase (cytochrome), electron transfer subunit
MARPGIRTTHPWRSQCTQCHAPDATLEQMPMPADLPAFWEN